jgi:transcriptional regulator with XRE-family HTH domain
MKNSAFHIQLKHERERRDLSQSDVGKMLNFSQQAIAKWESGHSSPDPETICRLADFFGISTDTLLGHPTVNEAPVIYRTKRDLFDDFVQSRALIEAYQLEETSGAYLSSLAQQLESYMDLLVSTTNKKD